MPHPHAGTAPLAATLVPVGALAGGIVSLTVGTALAKGLFPEVGAAGTTAFRVGFSALMLLAAWRPWRRPVSAREAATIALFGTVLGAMNLLFYQAIRTLPMGIAVAIEFSGPLAVALAGSRRASDFVWIGFAVLGLGLLLPLGGAGRLDPAGIGFALAAALAWALYIVLGQRAGRIHGGQAVSLGMTAAALFVLPFGIAEAGSRLLEPRLMLLGLVAAALSSALPYSLEMVALKRLPAPAFGVLLSMEPAIAALSAFAILGERLSGVQWLAVLSIIVASAGTAASAHRRARPQA
ncbi:EamA family transporter [Methylobacterium sp. A54F]